MVEELNDIFPHFTQIKIYKILLSIKCRYKKYWIIWISRLEASRFWTSERQMQYFIYYLREIKAINKIKMVKSFKNNFKCNVYSLSDWFKNWLEEVKEFIKKKFEYINPTEYVKARFPYKIEKNKLKFKINWDRYIIHLRWRFKDKIYDVWNNCIINPLLLTK